MNSADTHHFREVIEARLAMLEAEDRLGKQGQSTVELDQQAVGRLSRVDALQNQAMSKANHARRQTERQRLTAALKRIEEGAFGQCEDCGDDIAQGRLELDPAASRCIDCARG